LNPSNQIITDALGSGPPFHLIADTIVADWSFIYRCKLCGIAVLFTNDNLHSHLALKHNSTLKIYRQSNYILESCSKYTEAEKQVSGIKPRKKLASVPIVKRLKKEHLDMSPTGVTENRNDDLDQMLSDQRTETPSPSAVFSDRREDMCQIACNICRESTKCLRFHVKSKHQMVFREYKILYPGEVHSHPTFHRYCLDKLMI
jgi:hypothetical protein